MMPLVDLGREYQEIRSELDPQIEKVLTSGSYILGENCTHFEKELAVYCGVPYAAGCSTGTDAILLALRALGIGPGDDVIVPAMTFFATAEPVALLGARPVFVDIDPATYTIDPEAVRKKMTMKTRLIMAVHLYGLMADMKSLIAIAQDAKIPLMEDMAQSIGALYEGKKSGSFGRLSAVSFFPTKNLGACGDGGAVLSSTAELDERIRSLRNHGAKVKYYHDEIAYNSRLDELQAAILRVKLKRLDRWNDQRRALAHRYLQGLQGGPVHVPQEVPGRKHVFHLFSIRAPRRDALKDFLQNKGIPTGLHYPAPLHLQKAFNYLDHREGDFPVSEQLARETLSLPLYPHMVPESVDTIVAAIREFYKG
jgi:dTDP-4-amino-4,6-dideoxygalactose transaminase